MKAYFQKNYRILQREHSAVTVFRQEIVPSDVLIHCPGKRRDCDRIGHRYIPEELLFRQTQQTWPVRLCVAEHPLSLCGLCSAGHLRWFYLDQPAGVAPAAGRIGEVSESQRTDPRLAWSVRGVKLGGTGADPLLESANGGRDRIQYLGLKLK